MCIVEKDTEEVLEDCGSCGCGQSSNSGDHDPRLTGETVTIGNWKAPTERCADCDAYVVT